MYSSAELRFFLCRLFIRAPNNALVQLVWERVYQTTQPTPPTNVWVTQDMTNNLFWIRDNNQNYDGGSNFQTLATWASGFQVRPLRSPRRFDVGSGLAYS